ncbi:MAG: putative oxidoreductase [Halioglobus sp.]
MTDETRLKISLLGLRLGVFIVFIVWTLDKLLNYKHNSGMIMHYYHFEVPRWFLTSLGLAELILLLFFLARQFKTFTYGVILFAHTVTTLVSAWRLFPPYEVHQLLYFGSLPMLGACVALFLMREKDTLMTLGRH